MKLKKLLKKIRKDKLKPVPKMESVATIWDYSGLLIADFDGNDYRSQVGGCSCDQVLATGWFYECDLPEELDGLEYPDEDNVNLIFQRHGLRMKVDGYCQEAWIPVRIEHPEHPDGVRAILVYPNSD